MSVEYESRKVIDRLKKSAEETTGENYSTLTDAHQALKNGYGQGGEGKPEQEKTVDITENGTTEILPDEGNTLSKVTVKVEVEADDKIDMSLAVNAMSMFYDTDLEKYPLKNTHNIKSFRQAFYGCGFPEADIDITSCTDMRSAFYLCTKLEKLILRNAQKMTSRYFEQCFESCSALTDFNIDVLNIIDDYLDFSDCKNLTNQSLMNILNALSDNTSLTKQCTVKLGADNLAKLTAEQKQIATNKNIILA